MSALWHILQVKCYKVFLCSKQEWTLGCEDKMANECWNVPALPSTLLVDICTNGDICQLIYQGCFYQEAMRSSKLQQGQLKGNVCKYPLWWTSNARRGRQWKTAAVSDSHMKLI